VRLLHLAGVDTSALHLVQGDGRIGATLVAHPDVAGVVFTGSTEVARSINRTLAAKDGPIVPLIAETGGVNAMIVDATALPEQVADDVVTSAFRSAGQRCSALRLLFLRTTSPTAIEMIAGAALELRRSHPTRPRISGGGSCRGGLAGHIARMLKKRGCILPAAHPRATTSRRIFSNWPMPAN
jgi:RHH-type proline utilization regulon transcriptional repressor/proline dehydrogenase/delta 1-pyrroline-5-carboxylate dehydrogenase